MHARTMLAGIAASAVAMSAFTLTSGAAFAAVTVDPDDTTFVPVAADLVGVGSDTSQHAVKLLADGFNAQSPAPTAKLATYAATSGGDVTLSDGVMIARPNGSGAGKGLLYGSGNNTGVDFARSSSSQSDAETAAGLESFPYALDTVVTVTSGNVASNAPASLTVAQLVGIYQGTYTTWNQVGGTSTATIEPLYPQSGSGTYKFFRDQLKAANGGTLTEPLTGTSVQEHDPAPIQNDPNAIAPFSLGRAGLANGAVHIEGGFSADRAIYDVVRGSDVTSALVQSAFGESGFFCSTEARNLIAAAGFKQLATPAHGGACGAPTQAATSDFVLNQQVTTTTSVSVTTATANAYTAVASVTGSSAPNGTVDFYQGATLLTGGVPLSQGQASYTASGVAPGAVTITAKFVPDTGSAYDASQGDGTGTVKTGSSITETFPTKVVATKTAHGVVTVTLASTSTKATGSVKVYDGTKLIKTAALTSGASSVTLPVLAAGTHHLTATYAGDSTGVASTKAFSLVVAKTTSKVSETFPAKVAFGAKAKGVLKVVLTGVTPKATGSIKIFDGTKLLKIVKVTGGRTAVITLPVLKTGVHHLKAVYAGSSIAAAKTLLFKITAKAKKKH